jgi:GxxExxY protein
MQRKLPDRAERRVELIEKELTSLALKCFYKTYNVLGYGFLESVYRNALAIELRAHGLRVDVEVAKTVKYFDHSVGLFKVDLLVEEKLSLELKATEVLGPTDKRQLLNFLKAGSMDVGLLLHYGPEPKFYRLVHPKHLF